MYCPAHKTATVTPIQHTVGEVKISDNTSNVINGRTLLP